MDHVGCLSLGDLHTCYKEYHLKGRKIIICQTWLLVVVVLAWGFSAKVMAVFAILVFYFRTRILFQSGDDRGPGWPLLGDIFCISQKNFSDKSRRQGCTKIFAKIHVFCIIAGDSLDKWRRELPFNHDACFICSKPSLSISQGITFGFFDITRHHGGSGGTTRWIVFLQASRTFLNQNVRNQTAGKPRLRGQNVRVNPKMLNEY